MFFRKAFLRRVFSLRLPLSLLAAASLLAGCATSEQKLEEERLTRSAVARVGYLAEQPSGVSGEVCLVSGEGYAPSIDVFLLRALADRGFRVRLVEHGDEAAAKRCRLCVAVSGNAAERLTELSLHFTDSFTGEAKHALWRSDRTAVRAAYLRAPLPGEESAFLTGYEADPGRVARELVDRLFPATSAVQ